MSDWASEGVQPASEAADSVLDCNNPVYAHPLLSGLSQPLNRTRTVYNRQLVLQRKPLVPTCPPFNTYTCADSGNGQGTSVQTHHTLDTTGCKFFSLVGAQEQKTVHWKQKNSFFPQHITLINTLISHTVSEKNLYKINNFNILF